MSLYFQAVISQISAEGLTKISSATYIAFKQLEEKVYRNNVTSVFLLSDGQDGDALFEISDQIRHVKEVFTISTFGFGDDHDAQMMTSISNLKNGNFYYVKDITLLDEFFAHALGGIVSVIAEQIQISLSLTFSKPLQDLQISKTYGNVWKQRGNVYEINIPQLASGTRKDFVFEIQIPQIYSKIQDQERVVKVLEARLRLKDPQSGEIIQKSAALNLTLFNQEENVSVQEENIDVYSQYMRVKGTEAIDDAKRACEQNNFEDAQKLLDDMMVLSIYTILISGRLIFNNTIIEKKQQSCLKMCWNYIGFKLSQTSYLKYIIQFLWFQVVVLNSCQQQYIRRYEFRIFT